VTQLALDATGPEPDRALSAWHTPPELARALVDLAGGFLTASRTVCPRPEPLRILEPSAGSGALVRALLGRTAGYELRVTACEIDPRFEDALCSLSDRVDVEIVDYLARPAPAERYHLAVTNPPFTGGEETEHLAKLLDESERITALLPARSFHGRARYERVWSRCEPGGGWFLRDKVHCKARPKFSDEGGKDEIVLVHLTYSPSMDARLDADAPERRTRVRWL
jgi:predicted RNA methylase